MSRGDTAARSLGADQRVLARVLTAALGRVVRVVALDLRPCEFEGRWPSQILEAELDDGTRLAVFRKEVGLSGHPDKAFSDKEIRMYRDILQGADLPVPKYYGARLNPASERHELYLEYVAALSLKYHGIELWYRAAESIGELHVHFADRLEDLQLEEALPTLDARYFRTWGERARAEVEEYMPDLAPRLAALLAGHDEVVGALAESPRTLVHNDLGSRNVIVDDARDPVRVCIVDWENASVGCGVVDLTHLTQGLVGEPRQRMCEAYFAALEGTPLAVAGRGRAERLAAAGEVHRVVYRLGRCRRRGYRREGMLDLLAHAERFRDRI